MMTAMSNAKSYDWATWFMGIWRSVISGGAGSVIAGLTNMGMDPEHYNLANGLGHVLKTMGIMFVLSGIFHLFVFLQTHGAPDPLNGPKPA